MSASLHIAKPVEPRVHWSDAIGRVVLDLGAFAAVHLDIEAARAVRDQLDAALAQMGGQ